MQAVFVAHKSVEARMHLREGHAHLLSVLLQSAKSRLGHPALPEAEAENQGGKGKF